MPPYDAEATRRRLLDAAYAEFAQCGIAGARVDRIAEAADSNKAQIYHYFGSKTQLFDAVFAQTNVEMAAEVPFTPDDLPGYAGRLVRLHDRRPEIMRLITWQRLERSDAEPNPLAVAAVRSQVDAIAEVQEVGPSTEARPLSPRRHLRACAAHRHWLDGAQPRVRGCNRGT
jgi:AcrR family transcriptional regulator